MATTPKRKIYKAAYLSSLDYLDEVREFVKSIIEPLDLDDEQMNQVILSVDEAFTNAVRHAYKNSTSGRIDIRVAVQKNSVKISIIDYGRGFDPGKVEKKDITKYVQKMQRGGLGLFLIKSFMDKVEYKLQPGIRNEIEMVKELR